MAPERPACPLGPDSLTWRYFGDNRSTLLALWAGSMQNMHPGLGAGVDEHSNFFDERWERLFRSVFPIIGVVYDGPQAPATATAVRGYHRTIKGVDDRGRRYSALDPETWFWAHATFLMLSVIVTDRFGTPLSDGDKERLYAEGLQWYRLYGVSDRAVPPDWAGFCAWWDHMCADVLEDTPAARRVLDIAGLGKPPQLSAIPDPLWRLAWLPLSQAVVWLTVGLYPEPVRERMGLRWTVLDEAALTVAGKAIGAAWRFVPRRLRYHPRALAGWRRAEGRQPIGAPVLEAPAMFLPPEDERDDPRHYVPTG
jgi:uncharacterized protein (DUF2236 family)